MFYTNIKYFRKRYRITQKKLADKSNVSQSYISDLEKSTTIPKNISLDIIESLSISLDCCPKFLTMFDCETCRVRLNKKKCSIEECRKAAILEAIEHI